MKKIIGLAALTALMASTVTVSCDNVDEYVPPTVPSGYTTDWNAVADSSTTAFIQNFWNAEKGFFNAKSDGYHGETNNYWPQAHAMDVIIAAYLRTGDKKYSDMFDKWYEGIKVQCWSGSKDKFWVPLYDDNAWISISMMKIYDITKDTKYLEAAKYLHEDMMANGWDNENIGGLSWGAPGTSYYGDSRAICTNGPACVLAFKLYNATGDEHYAENGMKIYKFLREYVLDPGTGRVLNGINRKTLLSEGEDSREYSYTHGTVMASALEAYRYTGDAAYLKDAYRIGYYVTNVACADQATGALFFENKSWRWDDDGGDPTLFRAVLFPYLADVIEAPEVPEMWREKFFKTLNITAVQAWTNGILDRSDYSFIMYNSNMTKGVNVSQGEIGYLNPNTTGASCIEARASLYKSLGK